MSVNRVITIRFIIKCPIRMSKRLKVRNGKYEGLLLYIIVIQQNK